MGDIVHSLPVLSAVRKTYPDAEISWLVRTDFAGLLEGHPHLSRIILFDRKYLGTAWKNPKAFDSLVSLIMLLRKERFDLIIDLQGLFRTASLGWLSGCRVRVGPASGREFSRLFYTVSVKQDRDSVHAVDYYLKIAAAAGAVVDTAEFILPADVHSEKTATSMLNELGVGEKGYAVLIPGSAHSDKCWPSERFAAVADKISDRFGLSVIAVGTAGESRLVDDINAGAKVNVKNLAGRTDAPVLISLLRNAKIVISNDTGPGHIAAALKVPLVIIYGRSNPVRVGPYRLPQCVAAVEPDNRGDSINNFEDKYNIRHITVDEVYEKAKGQIK